MAPPAFVPLVARLFAVWRLPHDRTASAHPGYPIRINGTLPLDLIGLQQGCVNLRAVAGTLPDNVDSGPLRRLLDANQFAFEHPPVTIGVAPDTVTVTGWRRQALSEVHDDIPCRWFERFVPMASAVHSWRHSPQCPRGLDVDRCEGAVPMRRTLDRNNFYRGSSHA